MDIKQIKTDIDNGTIVSRETWGKLLEAALIQEKALTEIDLNDDLENPSAYLALLQVRCL